MGFLQRLYGLLTKLSKSDILLLTNSTSNISFQRAQFATGQLSLPLVFHYHVLLRRSAPNGKIMIGLHQVPNSKAFGINNSQWGLVNFAVLVISNFLDPISRTFGGLAVTHASTGIAGNFGRTLRGKIYGIRHLTQYLSCNSTGGHHN